MVSPETIKDSSRTSTRQPQLGCGLRVQNDGRSVRLDDKFKGVSANSPIAKPTTNRPVCILPDKTTASLLQLEARPRSRGDRYFYSELGPSKGICQPPMVSDFSVSEPNKTTTCKSTASNIALAIPALVPSNSRSSSTSSPSGHYPEAHQSGVHNEAGGSNTGRMARLREFLCDTRSFYTSFRAAPLIIAKQNQQ